MKTALIVALAAFPILSQAGAMEDCQKAVEAGDFATAAQTAGAQNTFDGTMCAGRAQQALGENAGARSTFAKAEALAKDKFGSMLAMTFQARAARAVGDSDAALTHYNRSLKLAHEIKAPQGEWANLNEIGQIYQDKKDFTTALGRFKDAYPFASNDNERSESNQLIAAAYHLAGDHDHAIEYQLKSVILEERSGDANQYLNAKLLLAVYAMDGHEYSRANNELSAIIKVSKEVESVYWEARATWQQSRMEKLRGNQDQSNALLKSATDLAEKSGVRSLMEEIRQGFQ